MPETPIQPGTATQEQPPKTQEEQEREYSAQLFERAREQLGLDPADLGDHPETQTYRRVPEEFTTKMADALMHTLNFRQGHHSDRVRHNCGHSPFIRFGGFITEPRRFWPPKNVTKKQPGDHHETDVFWHDIAENIMEIAQDSLSGSATSFDGKLKLRIDETQTPITEKLQHLVQRAIKNLYFSYSSPIPDQALYFDYDAAYPQPPEETTRQVQEIVDAYKAAFRERVIAVIQDIHLMDRITRAASAFRAVAINVVLEEDLKLIEHIRRQVETPEDLQMFLSFLKKAVACLYKTDGLEVEILDPRDALIHGCQGLYRSEWVKNEDRWRFVVCIPMTNYGTGRLIEWDDVLKTLAHEVAHYQTNRAYVNRKDMHDQLHNALTFKNLQTLRDLAFVPKRDPATGKITDINVIKAGAAQSPPIPLHQPPVQAAQKMAEKQWLTQELTSIRESLLGGQPMLKTLLIEKIRAIYLYAKTNNMADLIPMTEQLLVETEEAQCAYMGLGRHISDPRAVAATLDRCINDLR